MGIPVIPKFSLKYIHELSSWVDQTEVPEVDYADDTIPAIEYALSLVNKSA